MKNWRPEVGRLYLRCKFMNTLTEFALCFVDREPREPDEALSYVEIARMLNWTAAQGGGGGLDTVKGQAGLTDSGVPVYRRYILDTDLVAFFKLWRDGHASVEDWLDDLSRVPILRESEKERLRQALQRVRGA
ncbi:MAG: hypothetical protein WC641_02140 [Patescibacteria group bacterium]